jgi:hypothetical protein
MEKLKEADTGEGPRYTIEQETAVRRGGCVFLGGGGVPYTGTVCSRNNDDLSNLCILLISP